MSAHYVMNLCHITMPVMSVLVQIAMDGYQQTNINTTKFWVLCLWWFKVSILKNKMGCHFLKLDACNWLLWSKHIFCDIAELEKNTSMSFVCISLIWYVEMWKKRLPLLKSSKDRSFLKTETFLWLKSVFMFYLFIYLLFGIGWPYKKLSYVRI